jgi:hypothetical protein
MHKIIGNRANVKPAFTFNNTTPAQLRDHPVGGDNDATSESASADTNTTDMEGVQRGKKRRRSNRPDVAETMTTMLDVFQDKWADDKAIDLTIREEEKGEKQRLFEVMEQNQDSLRSVVDVLRIIAEKM